MSFKLNEQESLEENMDLAEKMLDRIKEAINTYYLINDKLNQNEYFNRTDNDELNQSMYYIEKYLHEASETGERLYMVLREMYDDIMDVKIPPTFDFKD